MNKKIGNKESEEFNPYANDKLAKIPSWLKILFLKYWVAAATFFFFVIGNPFLQNEQKPNNQNALMDVYMIFLVLGLGLFQEYIIKPIIKLMRNSRDDTYYYNVVNLKGIVSLLANFLYAFIILVPMVVVLSAMASRGWIINLFGNAGEAGAIEPLTAGFIYLIFDFIYLFIKNSVIAIINEVKYRKQEAKAKELEKELLEEGSR